MEDATPSSARPLAINNRTLCCFPSHMGRPITRIHFAPLPPSVCLSLFRCIVVPHLTMPLTDCSHQNRVAYNLCVQLGEERLSCWNIMLQHSHIKLHSPHLQKCFNYPKWMVQELINLNIHTRVHLHCIPPPPPAWWPTVAAETALLCNHRCNLADLKVVHWKLLLFLVTVLSWKNS